ncbi:MAG: DNA-directed DNA polymerase [Planctomycetota bacterium]|nr:MAG: DNA-directed DNA polymerase [Planctomycetota bacterium]
MPPTTPFTHLHVHSHYSLLDGAIHPKTLVKQAADYGMDSLALTDHGNLYGAIEFYSAAREAGINPILGCEAYLVPGDATVKPPPGEKRPRYHVTLLARDAKGFQNLSRLSTLSWTRGFHRKPCIDKHMLAAHGEGLIALSGCLSGEVNRALLRNELDEAVKAASEYAEILGKENVYLELMSNGLEPQRVVRDAMPAVAKATGLKLIATNDIHYRCEGDAVAQDALICIGTGQQMHDPNRRFRIDTNELFFRSSDEMAALFGADSEAYRSTREVADRCDIDIDMDTMHLPRFEIPTGEPAEVYMRKLCEEGLRRLYGEITPPVRERFEKEFQVIESMGFVSYFLIVWDLIAYARSQGIPVGPGRGSAAGSIVAYSLDITQLDPLKYHLLFERFLNADRISMPDIDIDFCRDRREEVIQYTRDKYGNDQVCQIITFGKLAAKAAVRDAGRVLQVPLNEVDKIAKRIPDGPGVSLKKSLDADKELRELLDADPRYVELLKVSRSIEGMARNASTHAAGVVITEQPLIEHVPLCVVQGAVNTQWQMSDLEKMGLLKMDFLGLKNLTILRKAQDMVKRSTGLDVDYDTLPLDDEATYALLKRGDTAGVFQLESSGMRELIVRLAPDCFEDIIALIALYRPGPLQSGMTDSFVNRKHGVEEIRYDHALMEPILSDTYGAMIYQEQVMLLAQSLGGLSLNDADGLRKAMGKKKLDVMMKYKSKFLAGCESNTISTKVADKIWDDMCQFAQYGFNKSHSAAYGLITYRTAYMKANHPGEYLAALMSCDAGDSEKLSAYMESARRSGHELLPPSANRSVADFGLESSSTIRMGFNAVKGVGTKAVESFVAAREAAGGSFPDIGKIFDFVDPKALNRSSFDALVKAGVFDELQTNRHALLSSSDRLLREAARTAADRAAGQSSLFGGAGAAALNAKITLDDVLPPNDREIYLMEKEALGFSITVDPMAEHRALLRLVATHDIAELAELPDRAEVLVGGMVTALRTTVSSKGRSAGQAMALFKVQGLGGNCSAVIFPRTYAECRELVHDEAVLLFRAQVDTSRDEPGLLVDEVIQLSDPNVARGRRLLLDIPPGSDDEVLTQVDQLKLAMAQSAGPTEAYLSIPLSAQQRKVYRLGRSGGVGVTAELVRDLEAVLGSERFLLR